jgi:hypothetical protein
LNQFKGFHRDPRHGDNSDGKPYLLGKLNRRGGEQDGVRVIDCPGVLGLKKELLHGLEGRKVFARRNGFESDVVAATRWCCMMLLKKI